MTPKVGTYLTLKNLGNGRIVREDYNSYTIVIGKAAYKMPKDKLMRLIEDGTDRNRGNLFRSDNSADTSEQDQQALERY